MTSSLSPSVVTVADLESIYDTKYRPSSQHVYALVPVDVGEKSIQHAVRVSKLASGNLEISDAMDRVRTNGCTFIRSFLRAYASPSKELVDYFEQSGFARLTNVFVMLQPYEASKWLRIKGGVLPESFSAIFELADPTSLPMQAWNEVILPESTQCMDPFPETTLKSILEKA